MRISPLMSWKSFFRGSWSLMVRISHGQKSRRSDENFHESDNPGQKPAAPGWWASSDHKRPARRAIDVAKQIFLTPSDWGKFLSISLGKMLVYRFSQGVPKSVLLLTNGCISFEIILNRRDGSVQGILVTNLRISRQGFSLFLSSLDSITGGVPRFSTRV